jgi:hypothetical protein
MPEPSELPRVARAMLLVQVVQAIATVARAIAEWFVYCNH